MTRSEFIKSISAFASVALVGGCGTLTCGKKEPKVLFVYFSQTGNTRFATEAMAATCPGARVAEIKPAVPYAADAKAFGEETKKELAGKALRPIAKMDDLALADYDLIFVGTPNWGGTLVPAVRTFLTENRDVLKTKTLCVYATFGGGGLQNIAKDFESIVAGAQLLKPGAFKGATIKTDETLKTFVAERRAPTAV